MEGLTIELTAIIYQRLFKNPPISMINSDRVYTLPESDIYAIPQEFPSVRITSESGSSEQSKAAASSSRMGSPPKVHDASTKKCSTETSWPSQPEPSPSLAEQINDHLHGMGLEELSDFEVQALNKIGIPDFLVKDSEGPSYYKPAGPDDEYSRNQRPEDPRPDPKHTSEYRDHARCFEAISGLCTFARVLESVDYISMLATRASSINRSMSRGNFEELEILCRRAKWHSRLLSVVSEELLHRSTHIDSIIRLVEDFI